MDSGKTEEIPSQGKIRLCKILCAKKEIVRDIIGATLKRRVLATSIEYFDTVKPYVNSH